MPASYTSEGLSDAKVSFNKAHRSVTNLQCGVTTRNSQLIVGTVSPPSHCRQHMLTPNNISTHLMSSFSLLDKYSIFSLLLALLSSSPTPEGNSDANGPLSSASCKLVWCVSHVVLAGGVQLFHFTWNSCSTEEDQTKTISWKTLKQPSWVEVENWVILSQF